MHLCDKHKIKMDLASLLEKIDLMIERLDRDIEIIRELEREF
jgi:hypothetical protein